MRGGMYQLAAPASDLTPYVDRYWMVRSSPGEVYHLSVDVYVDAQADLVINHGDSYRRRGVDGAEEVIRVSNVDAQRTRPMVIHQDGVVSLVGVRFTVGGLAAFSDVRMADFTDRVVPVREILKRSPRLEEDLADSPTLDARKEILDRWLRGLLEDRSAYRTFRAVLEQASRPEVSTVDLLAHGTGLSPRTIGRLFARHLGLGPKFYLRVARFQRALRRIMGESGADLGEVAAEAGYYDQPHLVREFHELAGGLPRERRGYLPPTGADFAPNVVRYTDAPTD